MNKPIVFFSHTTADKETILSIKEKVDSITGGAIDVFMSSDGQSIPFGTNWIHKVESGLMNSRLMFVFVSENSVSSGWVYFETGYAYSKGIRVVPIGLGIDIGSLKPPLNMLQGFNISSEESLNNIINILNKEFDYHFEGQFSKEDYVSITSCLSTDFPDLQRFEWMIEKAELTLIGDSLEAYGSYYDGKIGSFYLSILNYLDENCIHYSKIDNEEKNQEMCIVSRGIRITYIKSLPITNNKKTTSNATALRFSVAVYNYINSISLLIDLLKQYEGNNKNCIRLHLNPGYSYVTPSENGAAIICRNNGFDLDSKRLDTYTCGELGLKFCVMKEDSTKRAVLNGGIIAISFDENEINPENSIKLINSLFNIGFIFEC